MVDENNFRWAESSVPTPSDGEVLIRNLWLSFDPTQRSWMSRETYVPIIPLGEVMRGLAVGQVAQSRKPDYAAGELVLGLFGWQDYIATDGEGIVGMRKIPAGLSPTASSG